MDRVDFPDGSDPLFNPAAYGAVKEKKRSKAAGRKRLDRFPALLRQAELDETATGELETLPAPSEEALRGLLDDVHAAGEELKSKTVPDTIIGYKKAVRRFLRYVVENSFDVEERVSGINIMKRKKFTLIQVIDQKLERLAAGILEGQRGQLNLLAKLDEIAGLLVDLTR